MNKSAVFLRTKDRRIGTELHSAITCARIQRYDRKPTFFDYCYVNMWTQYLLIYVFSPTYRMHLQTLSKQKETGAQTIDISKEL